MADLQGTVIRLLVPEGTLVVEVDDPAVRVTLEGTDIIITGAGAQEIRLKPGAYQLSASRDGKVIKQELVTVSREGRRIVRISKEATPSPSPSDAEPWERRVLDLAPEAQVSAVTKRLQELNPGHDGKLEWTSDENGAVGGVVIVSDEVSDLSPLRAFSRLAHLHCEGSSTIL